MSGISSPINVQGAIASSNINISSFVVSPSGASIDMGTGYYAAPPILEESIAGNGLSVGYDRINILASGTLTATAYAAFNAAIGGYRGLYFVLNNPDNSTESATGKRVAAIGTATDYRTASICYPVSSGQYLRLFYENVSTGPVTSQGTGDGIGFSGQLIVAQ